MSIFTAFAWSKSLNLSFVLPTLDLTYDKSIVDSAVRIILNHIKTVLQNIKEINFFPDGAASQFKQRLHFRNLTQIAFEQKVSISWNFFVTSHGKGVVDGIGGIGLMQKYPPIFKKMFLNDVALLWMRGFHAYDTASVS